MQRPSWCWSSGGWRSDQATELPQDRLRCRLWEQKERSDRTRIVVRDALKVQNGEVAMEWKEKEGWEGETM